LDEFVISQSETLIQRIYFYIFAMTLKLYTTRQMKKLILLLAICGTLAVSSCTKHACPAYGSTQKTVQPAAERV
jgi:hypothetical protein